MALWSFDYTGTPTAGDIIRIPDGQATIDARSTWDDSVAFDWVCRRCGWHSGSWPSEGRCPECRSNVEWQDDPALISTALRTAGVSKGALALLEKQGVVNTYGTLESEKPEVFISLQKAQMFSWSAIAQLWRRVQELEGEVARLKAA